MDAPISVARFMEITSISTRVRPMMIQKYKETKLKPKEWDSVFKSEGIYQQTPSAVARFFTEPKSAKKSSDAQ